MRPPIWFTVLELLEGLAEKPGPGSNPVILHWAKLLGIDALYHDDDEAWCALTQNAVMYSCQLPVAGTGYDLVRARSFLSWGRALDTPQPGALMVFGREGGAHVAQYVSETPSSYYVLGGNQGNAVSRTWMLKSRLLPAGIRWPLDVPVPAVSLVK